VALEWEQVVIEAVDAAALGRWWTDARLLAHGATRVDVGQGADVPWVVLADPEGNEFCVLGPRS
jgi:hypothetical protein